MSGDEDLAVGCQRDAVGEVVRAEVGDRDALVAERGVDLAGVGVAHERDVAVDRAGDHDPPVAGLDHEGTRDVRPRSQIGRDDPVAAEARVERAVAEVAGQREVVVRAQRAGPGGESGDDDLAVGLHGDRVGLVDLTGEVGLDDAAVSEAGIETAVGVVADDSEVAVEAGPVSATDDHESALRIERRIEGFVGLTAEVGRDDAAVPEAGIEIAVGVVTREREVDAAAHGATTDSDDAAVGLEEDGLGLAVADHGRHPAVATERRIETRWRCGRRAVHGDVGHVGAGHGASTVAHRADLIGVARLGRDRDVVGQAVGDGAGERERPVARRRGRAPMLSSTSPEPCSPPTVPPIVKLAGSSSGESSSDDRRLSPALLTRHAALDIGERDRERLVGLGFVVRADRDLDEPRGRVPVGERDARARLGVVGARLGRAGTRGDDGARLAARPVRAGDAYEHRHAGRFVGDVRGLAQLQRSGRRVWPGRALRRRQRLDRRRREVGAPRAFRPVVSTSVGRSRCGSWMNASAADSRPRRLTVSASRVTSTANNSPSLSEDRSTFMDTGWLSSATACDRVPRSSTSSSIEKLPLSQSGARESADVVASIVQWPS